jgi:hypothetical protein
VLIVKPSQTVTNSITCSGFGDGISAELFQVKHVNITTPSDNLGRSGPYPDPIIPLTSRASVTLAANENTSFWIIFYVASSVATGDYTGSVQIGTISVPVKLHVFNFAIPQELHIQSQMNFSYESILNKYGVTGYTTDYWNYVDKIKTFFIRHRLTPRNPCWPGGFTSGGGTCFISYDCTNGTITDNDGIWGFEQPSDKYINGVGFNNGSGFPSFQAITFRDNDAGTDQRPPTFCSVERTTSDWYTGNDATTPYNTKWFAYLKNIQTYLSGRSLIDKAYYYLANEPQDQTDYDAVAWYTQEIKKAAPSLKLMVSEEPRPEIYNHPVYKGAKVDIWLPVLNNYNPSISWNREAANNEVTWIYFLHGTRPPYFNPITLDHPGIESKLCGWFLWKYRIKGIAYYSINDWSKNPWTDPSVNNHNGELFMLYPPSETNTPVTFGATDHRLTTSQRFELLRDGFEDFEYLYVLNSNKAPVVNVTNPSDSLASKITNGLINYCRDDEYIYNLRRVIGLKIGGEIATIPDITPSGLHPRATGEPGNYYINFQNPSAEPAANPLVVDGKTFMKIGWNQWSDSLGYGWYGDLSHTMYKYLSSGPNELQRSIMYDDFGLQKSFEFSLPDGEYNVTVSVGWGDKAYAHQKISIEGIDFVNDETTTTSNPYIVRTKKITVSDKKLTLEMGITGEYTMLNYITIEAVKKVEVPQAVTLRLPVAGDTVKTDTLLLSWLKGTPSVDRYRLNWGVDSLFENTKTDSSITDTLTIIRGLANNSVVWWRVQAHNTDGWGSWSTKSRFVVHQHSTKVKELSLPVHYRFTVNRSRLAFDVPKAGHITLQIFGLNGTLKRVLINGFRVAGCYTYDITSEALSAGPYIVSFSAGNFSQKKLLFLAQ